MHPTLVAIGPVVIRSYSVALVLALVASSLVALWLAKKDGLDATKVATFLFFLAPVALLGARVYLLLFYFLKDPASLVGDPGRILKVLEGGGVFHGGLIAGILFSVWYLKKTRMSFWRFSDIAGPGLALGHSIGRIGCFLAGCCSGKPTHFFLAVQFPRLSPPVHPTQLYESVLNLGNFLLLLLFFRKRKFPGQILALYLMNYSVIRFLLEYLRAHPHGEILFASPFPLLRLSLAQVVSLLGFVGGIVLYRLRRKERTIPTLLYSLNSIS